MLFEKREKEEEGTQRIASSQMRTKKMSFSATTNGTFSLSQMSRTELARVMPWREKEG